MKEFWVYTALRLLVFVASFAIVFGVWALVSDTVSMIWVLLLSLVLSGLASYYLLHPYRERFARQVQAQATRASVRLEQFRSTEDKD